MISDLILAITGIIVFILCMKLLLDVAQIMKQNED